MLLKIVLLSVLCLLPRIAAAQVAESEPVDDREVRVLSHVPAIYPQIAQSARIEGVVVVAVSFDEAGKVTKTTVLSGDKLLRDAAVASVARWTFAPSRQGRAIIVSEFRTSGLCDEKHTARPPVFQPPAMATAFACTPIVQP